MVTASPGTRSAPAAWLAAVALLLSSCCPEVRSRDGGAALGDGGSGAGGSAQLSVIQKVIFDRHCVSDCHELGNAAASLKLGDGKSYQNLVQQASHQITSRVRVVPGSPDTSYLVKKMEGGAGMVGDRMPRLAPPRPEAEVQLIRAWITRGAPND